MEKNKIKIAYIIGKCWPGGILSYSKEYSRVLLEQGYCIDFFVDDDSPDQYCNELSAHCTNVIKVPSIKRPLQNFNTLAAKLYDGNYDIAHAFLNTLNPLSMLAAKKAGIQCRIAENLSTGSPHEKKTIIKNCLKPFSRIGSTAIAANSNLSRDWLYGSNSDECFIINNPVNLQALSYSDEIRTNFRSKYNLNSKFIIGCIARFEVQKNHKKLIDVFAELKKVKESAHLFLVGHGSLEGAIKQYIEELDLQDSVSFAPTDTSLVSLYNAFDVFVLPSLYEGLPMVVVEAQVSGLPCVISSKITNECMLCPNVVQVDLEADAAEWAEQIIETSKAYNRKNCILKSDSDFALMNASLNLDKIYKQLLR